jgi:prepilin-type N-terminal cleavage/methylation domain-containing protein
MKDFYHKSRARVQRGFTLVELLIVVIILAILAAIVVPQFGSSTEDAQVSTLESDLTQLRTAIELYYHQHNSTYPGAKLETTGAATSTVAEADAAFLAQLTQYTDKLGVAQGTKDATHKYGPYIKTFKIPDNPFLDGASASVVKSDITVSDVTTAPTADGTSGWKFYVKTGRMVANDNTTLSDGVTKTLDF